MNTLVVVDDESLVTDFLTFLLEGEGYTVHVAANGKEALEVIGRVRPMLVITDLMMPVMSGLELAKALRAHEAFARLPVILCSAAAHAVAQEERTLFSAILQKPQAPAALLSVVAQHARTAKDERATNSDEP
ncbi:response regulator [Paraburkholderia phymatum]|uniref:Response regulator receiver protein n=1 Tax=Paraburkholderia phymatum (strain DSM 17167 / CIP 108236 / LMG 21445 / STM815) TaxID=391038 RepID=B2JRX4_PARP8|nr:response regulator [Paraburkholderia phymatum]ACC73893.1 response regulator receiver protein [Paraburkholderia phymatum STM815]